MLDRELEREMATVPDFDTFLTVDELEASLRQLAARSDAAQLRRLGTSRRGDPLHCLTIGEGPQEAVVFGLPHPNEPIGGLTALHLAKRLIEDEDLRRRLGLRWHIVACIDPDGTRLNEDWLHGPYTREHYARHFYRPAGDEQVEWTFPFQYKRARFDRVLPETQALMQLIDDTRPALMCSLHNGELGGVYYYLSSPQSADLYASLQDIPKQLGLGLDAGEAEAPYIELLADGIYQWPSTEMGYDYAERLGRDPLEFAGGTSSAAYADRHGTLTLVSELPYWDDPRATDRSPSDAVFADVLRQQAKDMRELVDLLQSSLRQLAGEGLTESPFLRSARYFAAALDSLPGMSEHRAGLPETQRLATVAEHSSCVDLVHSFRLRYAGLLRRALEAEVTKGNTAPRVRSQLERVSERYSAWLAEAEADSTAAPIPIRSLVATQYTAIIATARHLGVAP